MATITIPGMFLTGDHASRPAATAVGGGALYSCTDHNKIYQSDGSAWSDWATFPSSAAETGTQVEIDYVAFTSGVNVTATTEATADTVVTASAEAFDGSTIAVIEFWAFSARPRTDAQGNLAFWLYDGSSSIGRIGLINAYEAGAVNQPVHLMRRLTPSNASHTYSVRASVSSGTGNVGAGAGGSTADVPGFIRISKLLA